MAANQGRGDHPIIALADIQSTLQAMLRQERAGPKSEIRTVAWGSEHKGGPIRMKVSSYLEDAGHKKVHFE